MRLLINYLIIFTFLLTIAACANQSGKKERPRLLVKHVFTNGLPDPYDGSKPDVRHDYYYAYNYTEADYPLFEKMLDTLFIDTSYWSHSYFFLKYDNELLDTLSLRREMENPYGGYLENDPGSAKYNKYIVLGFSFYSGFVSQADQLRPEKVIPDNYSITNYEGNKITERYFLKDRVNGNLVEVDRSVVSIPDSGIGGK